MNFINYKFETFNCTPTDRISEALFGRRLANFLKYNVIKNSGGNPTYRSSHLVESFFFYDENNTTDLDRGAAFPVESDVPLNYIISLGVADAPNDWAGKRIKWPPSVFKLLNPTYLQDLQNKKALFLIDQSLEGYHKTWLWEWFHEECSKYQIDPSAIIYATGNQAASDDYNTWHEINAGNSKKLKIIPSIALSMPVYKHYQIYNFDIKFTELLSHKKENIQNISLYDCINFKFRTQRIINFLHLINENLIDDGKISIGSLLEVFHKRHLSVTEYNLPSDIIFKIPDKENWIAGDPNTQKFGDLIARILKDVYANTWVSLVTESSFFKEENTVFISEKTFKPIACMQPFIILGSKGTLKYLRKLGYKTFDGFIDESYDDCEDVDRFAAIIKSLKQIKNISDKVAWYESMQEILEHNHKLFLSIGTSKSIEHLEVIKYYNNYFKESHV